MAQQYIQVHGVPGTVNTTIFPFGQLGMPYVSGHGYAQGYTMPGHHYVQLTGPNVTGVTALPLVQAPYNAGKLRDLRNSLDVCFWRMCNQNVSMLAIVLVHTLVD